MHPAIYGYDVAHPELRSDLDSAPYTARSVVVDPAFDWEGDDAPQRRRWRDTVIYELHVKGMTALHDRVPEHLRGTYAGLATPAVIEHLDDLGVTAVELLPVHQFFSEPALAERGLVNYWGYNTLGFFAPHDALRLRAAPGQQVARVQGRWSRRSTRPGIEVILDVVYNHTAEAGPDGPTLSFRGLDDLGYYQRVVTPTRWPSRARHLLGRHRLRQHRRRQPHPEPADDPRLAALLGQRDARRRLPLRPAERADPHRPGGRPRQPPA